MELREMPFGIRFGSERIAVLYIQSPLFQSIIIIIINSPYSNRALAISKQWKPNWCESRLTQIHLASLLNYI